MYGRNPFLKYKPQKLSRIRLALRNYLRKMNRLGLNIFEVIDFRKGMEEKREGDTINNRPFIHLN